MDSLSKLSIMLSDFPEPNAATISPSSRVYSPNMSNEGKALPGLRAEEPAFRAVIFTRFDEVQVRESIRTPHRAMVAASRACAPVRAAAPCAWVSLGSTWGSRPRWGSTLPTRSCSSPLSRCAASPPPLAPPAFPARLPLLRLRLSFFFPTSRPIPRRAAVLSRPRAAAHGRRQA